MMYHALGRVGDANSASAAQLAIGASDPYAGTDALGPLSQTPGQPPSTATDLASSTATADCNSSQQVCHWYCYIPFMATPDCLQSFQAGTAQIAQGATSAATGTVTSFVGGIASGIGAGLNPGGSAQTSSILGTVIVASAAVFAVLLLTGKRR